ncbi:hypothetical protein PP422_gp130 [Enterobacter phage vB_EhoM-IME523]|uniref:Uncharacterized protein n=1 Tax=Enterobacter phage vB_EhoM-IME523 TaxID=2596709 RepID=A0A7G3KEC6_9CAUD|nr:hypothetical protein PP422_gp130 [Enterobacter phage vB_EhoM-IME523]QEA10609.1 hypothetical protein [Enterobacter phage vB_EhoM-IME523]
MIIKQLYLWWKNASWSGEDFCMFAIVIISFACAFMTAMFTYWGLSIFGPWFQGSAQVWYFTWASAAGQQFYFWTRWARYVRLYRQGLLSKTTGEIATNGFIKKWWNTRKYAKENLQNAKNREREIALGFAGEIKKVTGGHKLV